MNEGLKVIGAGFGRTGTSSLKVALERLGFGPTYHMEEILKSRRNAGLWDHYLNAGAFDWDEVLKGYGSAVDWPTSAYYEELAEKYPEAKIILTVREPGSWYESARRTIYAISKVSRGPVLTIAARTALSRIRHVSRLAEEVIWQGEFDGRFEDREYAIRTFERHNEEVKRNVPSGRLLIYEVKEGWGPLCEFLGVPVPDEDFPRLNDTKSFRRMVLALRAVSVAVPAVLAAVSVYTLFKVLRR